MALVHTGWYKAASRSPTTPAFTPASADWLRALRRSVSQKGTTPITNRKEGVKMARMPTVAPTQPDGCTLIEAPRKAANVESGPGMACARP
ncbi:hypothetical protein D3C79_874030 [compost metagenome]